MYYEMLSGGYAVRRPPSPGYPAMTKAFSAAFAAIIAGQDVKTELDRAAAAIDDDLDAHDGYTGSPRPLPSVGGGPGASGRQ
jgi:multiple sugar transport system substrate-binding protein